MEGVYRKNPVGNEPKFKAWQYLDPTGAPPEWIAKSIVKNEPPSGLLIRDEMNDLVWMKLSDCAVEGRFGGVIVMNNAAFNAAYTPET
jgi:hypothetical protein